MIATSTGDFRLAARRRLPRFLFDYVDGGAGAEATLRRNEADLEALAIRQRVLRDVREIDLSCTLFSQRLSLPIVLGPVGLTGMYARRGEAQAARAAADRDIAFCLSTVSVCALDEVVAASSGPIWFQLYVIRDRGFMRDLLARAKAQGARTGVHGRHARPRDAAPGCA